MNGILLDSPEHALETYVQTKEESRVSLEVERDGELLHLTYFIKR
jgi:hypothetical protein